jgi:magnesium chelatase family protein
MNPAQMQAHCVLDEEGRALMKNAFDRLGLTARSYDRVLRVARTIADLDGSPEMGCSTLPKRFSTGPGVRE